MNELYYQVDSWSLIKLVGGITVVISAVISFLAILIRDLINNKLDISKQKIIEELKHSFSKSEKLLEGLTSSISSIHIASNSIIIDGYKAVWASVLQLRKLFPPVAFIAYSVLSKDELETIPTTATPRFKKMLSDFQFNDYIDKTQKIYTDVEKYRPFVGTVVWNAFFSYQAFQGRLVYLLNQGKLEKKIILWYEDEMFCKQILGLSIESSSLIKLLENKTKAYNNIINFLELKIVDEVQNYLLGRKIADEALKQALIFSNKEMFGLKD